MVFLQIVHWGFMFYTVLLFLRVAASWIPELYKFAWMRHVYEYTEPYLAFFRRFIPPFGMIDISPIVAFIALGLIERHVALPLVYYILQLFYM